MKNIWSLLVRVCALLILGSASLAFGQSNPAPFVSLPLLPGAVTPGSAQFTMTVNGTNFVSGSIVNWNGAALATTFVSSSQLTAVVPASNVATAGTSLVTVSNPAPGGGASNVALFDVTTPVTHVGFVLTNLAAGSKPSAITAGDFTGTHRLDLAVANQVSNTVSVLLANTDGTFQTHVDYNVGSAPVALATGDFNHDGNLDLAVVNSGGNTVSILLGNGNGTFQTAQSYNTGHNPAWVAVGDFNGDGNLDLAVPNFNDNTVSILTGKGDGTFATHRDFAVGAGPASAAIGDFNKDGILDIVVPNFTDNSVYLLEGNGDATFVAKKVLSNVKSNPHSVTVGDFNGDGNLDFALCNEGSNTTSIAFGNGDGTFRLPLQGYSTGSTPTMELTADLNGDGILDLISDNLSTQSTFSYLLGNSDGSFQFHINYSTGLGPLGVTVGDFNNDGMLDLAVADSQSDSVSIMQQVPAVEALPTSLSFGNWPLQITSASQQITISNNTSASVAVSSIVATGDFGYTGACKSIGSLKNCAIQVTFTPTALGTRTGSISITEADNSSPLVVNLTGVGIQQAALTPTTGSFGSVTLGNSVTKNFTLTNNLKTAISISTITVPAQFSQTNTCGSSLASKTKCTISVTFTPTIKGKATGNLSVNDSALNSPQTAALQGIGAN